MPATNLHRMLAEKKAEIFSAIPSTAASTHRLRALQEGAFSFLLSAIGEETAGEREEQIVAAAKDASASHGLAEQIGALDHLETAILELPLRGPLDQSLVGGLLRAAGIFSIARQLVAHTYSRQSAAEPCRESVVMTEAPPGIGEQFRAIHLFDEVMHEMLDPSLGPERVLKTICEGVLKVTTADALAIHIIDRDTGNFVLRQFMSGPSLKETELKRLPEFLDAFGLLPRGTTGLFEVALAQRRPVFSADVGSDPRIRTSDLMSDLGIKAMLVVPMFESGKEFGFMSVVLASARTFERSEIESLSLFADQAAVAWRNAELYSELRKSEQRYRNLIENAIDIIFILDTEGRFVSINRRAEAIIGFKAEDWIGRHFSEIISPEDLPRVMEGWSAGLKGGTKVLPVTIKNAGGEHVHLEINSSLIQEEGELKGLMCIARDATTETKREEEFRNLHASVVEANRRLGESMARLKAAQAKLVQTEKLSAMTELMSGVAHELNNPLTGILGYTQLLLESLSDSKHRENLQKINNETVRCRRIVQNLQGFARGDKPTKKPVDINAVIRSIVDLREYQVRSDGIRLVTSLAEDQPQIMGDFHQLQQAVLNLLNNAHQAITSSGKGQRIEIRTETDERNNSVRVAVTDDGPGILPEDKPRIFDPFFTTREVGEATGLGLSLVYGIVQEHDGHISVESTPNKGATFELQLPLADVRKKKAAPTEPRRSQVPGEGRRVLVVDDEEVIIDLLADILAQMGMEAEKARNGKEALEKISTVPFDFIICDLKMPGMDGKALYNKVQELDPALSRRIIFSTGDTLSEDFKAFRAVTDCKFVDKPFMIEDLKDAIEALDRP